MAVGSAPIDNAITEAGTLTGAIGNVADSLINSAVGAVSPFNNFGRYFTGSRAIIKINDKLFGFAFGVTYNIQTSVDEIKTIDSWVPYELCPKMITVNGTLSMFHIPGKGPSRELIMPNVLSFIFHRYITISIRDHTTDQVIFETNKAFITGKSQSIRAGEISEITLEWRALGWADEMAPAYPEHAIDGSVDLSPLSDLNIAGQLGSLSPF
jgi:hypothetical protein